ncbi:MAG TPA: type I restriction-modification enzyme R subunit C-terminal domain-containing protein [Chthoniobacterales bacterium]|nr:type I restriction-modification enzyme R subunit C-terminal domain-containing protein [Chthoniobacterales bacterium]
MPAPEELARQKIDALLGECDWIIQDYKKLDLSAGRGIAIREVRLKEGRCDYLLLIDRHPVGIIEAKKAGVTLSSVAYQSGQYAKNLPVFLRGPLTGHLPFLYESTGIETFFRDERDPHPRSRRVFSFHRPETLAKWLEEPDTLRRRLSEMPFKHPYNGENVRVCRVEAISGLEQSFAEAQPRALIQMATGAGKTLTACAFTYRLIKHAGARNVLFLVDRANLGRQAMAEFQQFVTPDGRKFTELYNVQHLTSNKLDGVCRVTICTIQRLYAMLRGEELNEDLDEKSGFEIAAADQRTRDVQYNAAIPIETFDFIIADECHRSIYNLWRQVLEYFDAFLIGLTATPGKQAIGFFNKNLVSEYPHERAVADGVNVGYDVYRIKTQVTEQGGTIEKGLFVDRRDKKTRKLRWEELDDDLPYTAKELDRSIVVKDQIRTVLQAFRDALPQLFPGRNLVPKTLIFCKDDSHAEDVVHLCREVFGKGNDFCKKITYQSKHPETGKPANGETLIQEFRLSPQLRIAVTVDMIATGTDVKPLECLVFLRDVRSRVYFEQMKGRGTRVLSPTDLQAVSGAEAQAKTHFVIVDAVGVCESDKTDSRPLDRKPTEKLESILLGVALGKRDDDTLTTLASRLARMEQLLDAEEKSRITAATGGKTLPEMANKLLQSVDPDKIAEEAAQKAGVEAHEVSPEALEQARATLIAEACSPFDKPEVRDTLVRVKHESEQTIDVTTIDTVIASGFDVAAKDKAEETVRSFRDYIAEHQSEIDALQILYSRPYKQRLTEPMLKELEKKLGDYHASWTEDRLWDAFAVTAPGKVKGRSQAGRFADLVSLVRFALEQQSVLAPFADSVSERFNEWLMNKAKAGTVFNTEQLAWLNLMRDQIATSLSIEPDDLDLAPFNQRGGLGKAHQLFGEQLPKLLDELNEVLAA